MRDILLGTHVSLWFVSDDPRYHKDQCDRLLAAQALMDGIPLVSADAIFDR
jgi:PIN domain nuclease of toxin-antitoxin system